MKKLLLICSCFFSMIAVAQQINEPFYFPIKPGTKEWSGLRTEKDRFAAMQIPDEILSRMSTSALVVSCLNFPAFGYIAAYNNIETGFVILATKFNGLKELAKRNDAAKCLMDFYLIAGENGFEGQNPTLDQKYWTIKFSWIELLLAQNKLIESLDSEGRKKLLILAQGKYKIKQSSKDYSINSLLPTTFLMARVLHLLNYEEFESEFAQKDALRNFINTSELSDIQMIDRIFELTHNFLDKQK